MSLAVAVRKRKRAETIKESVKVVGIWRKTKGQRPNEACADQEQSAKTQTKGHEKG